MKKTKLSSASDVITRKRQQGTTEHYMILDEKDQLPIGGIPHSHLYDIAHVTEKYTDQEVEYLPCPNGISFVLGNFSTLFRNKDSQTIVFTPGSGTYTLPAGQWIIQYELIGGGGGGTGGGGGGSGWVTGALLSGGCTTISYTVGAKGLGAISSLGYLDANGNLITNAADGGNTTLNVAGTIISSTGGKKGGNGFFASAGGSITVISSEGGDGAYGGGGSGNYGFSPFFPSASSSPGAGGVSSINTFFDGEPGNFSPQDSLGDYGGDANGGNGGGGGGIGGSSGIISSSSTFWLLFTEVNRILFSGGGGGGGPGGGNGGGVQDGFTAASFSGKNATQYGAGGGGATGVPQSFQDYNLVKGGDGGDGHLKLTITRQ
jgi:hypothetical protein